MISRHFCFFLFSAVMACGLGASRLAAAANVTIGTPVFTAAQAGRTYMDVGNVWTGTATTTNGDRISVTFTNNGDDTAFDFRPQLVLPANIQRVGTITGTVSGGAAIGTVTASGTTGTITFNPITYDLVAGASITYTFGVQTTTAILPGTYTLIYSSQWAAANGGTRGPSVPAVVQQNILVQAGAYVSTVNPAKLTLKVNDAGTYTYSITNTGLGGLFNLQFNEALSNPGSAWSFQSFGTLSVTGTAGSGTPSKSGTIVTIPYLAPGASLVIPVNGLVTNCLSIANAYAISTLTQASATGSTPIELDLTKPLIDYALPTINLGYATWASVAIPVNNTGNGAAVGVSLASNFPAMGVAIQSVGAGWTYNSTTGVFTLTSGTIANGSSYLLSFQAKAADNCNPPPAGTYIFTAIYTDRCGNNYTMPTALGAVNAPADTPTLTLTKTAADARIMVGTASSFTLTVSATNLVKIQSTQVIVTDNLPAGLTGVVLIASAGTATRSGDVVTWTVPRAVLTTAPTLKINFIAPGTPCDGGTVLINTASTNTLTTTGGCSLAAGPAQASILLYNGPGATVSPDFVVTAAPAYSAGFETGLASADAVRSAGEGEFIPLQASYDISTGFIGGFAGSSYYDDFGGIAGARLVPGTVQASINNGGIWTNVPAPSITSATADAHLTINLGFLAGPGWYNMADFSEPVGGNARNLRFRYKITAPDAALGANSTRSVRQRSTLTITASTINGGCGGGVFYQWVEYTLARANASISVTLPTSIEVCSTFPVTITVSNLTGLPVRNLRATLLTTGNYEYIQGQTPGYGGSFAGNPPVLAENGGNNPTFTATTNLSGTGLITVMVRRKSINNTTASPLSVQLAYDDGQTAPAAVRAFPATGDSGPVVVRKADLQLLATPQSVYIVDKAVNWTAYLTNGGNGTAYGTSFKIAYPVGVTPATAAQLVAANPQLPGLSAGNITIDSGNNTVTFALGDIGSGQQRKVFLVGTLNTGACSFSGVANQMQGLWGCGGEVVQTATAINPVFSHAPAQIQVVHDTTNSSANLCDTSTVGIILRNVGLTTTYDMVVTESLGSTASTGLIFVPGTVQKSINGGAYVAAANPSGPGTNIAAGILVWDKNNIPELATLAGPTNPSGGINTVRIRFSITSNETTNGVYPVINASATGILPCGSATSSPGQPYPLPINKPNIHLEKTGINRTVAGGAFSTGTYVDTVYGGTGDSVEWRVKITNAGNYEARNVQLSDALGSSGGAVSLKNAAGTTLVGSYVNNTLVSIPNIPIGQTVYYYFVETLANCVQTANTATVVWGCGSSGLVTPTTNTGTAALNMIGSFSGSGIVQQLTTLPGGRGSDLITLTNQGGTVRGLTVSLVLPAGYVLDQSVLTAGAVAAGNFSTDETLAGKYTGVTVSVDSATTYKLTFTNAVTGLLTNGKKLTVRLHYLPTVVDTTANLAGPTMAQVAAYQMPETVANGLDPAPPAGGAIIVTTNPSTTCSIALLPDTNSVTLSSAVPDLDLTVSPTPLQFDPANAPYTYIYDFRIVNAGQTGSTADHITFSLPTVGTDWTSISAQLITPGTGGVAGTATVAPYSSLAIGTLAVNQFAIVRVTAVTKSAAAMPVLANLVLVGQVQGALYNQNNTAVGTDYSLDRAAPLLTGGANVSGYLYLDANHDGVRTSSETGLGSGTYYAKVLKAGVVVAVTAINATTGYYEVDGLSQGDYTVIVDDNNTAGDATPLPAIAGYVGTEMPLLTRNFSIGVTSINNQNFGVFRGSKITGTVFKDIGLGGGTANDGVKNGTEPGLSGVTVKATNGGSTTYETTLTDGNGDYTLWVAHTTALPISVIETNPASYISTGASPGTSGGAYTLATDTLLFNATGGTSYTGLNFGDVPPNAFLTDGEQTILPGNIATYAHTFVAGTTGRVSFSVASTASPALDGWSALLYRDLNGNGATDPGEPLLNPGDLIAVTAGQEVKLVLKQFAPVVAPFNARTTATITTSFTVLNAGVPVPGVSSPPLTRQDITHVGPSATAGLDLLKTVDKANALPGEDITYTLTYVNNGPEPLSNVIIYDQVPAYTLFRSATAAAPPDNLTAPVIAAPAVNAKTGQIKWTFGGTLAPGGTAKVSFVVRIQN